jgi:hypothetical protein
MEAETDETTFVAEQLPDFPSNCRVVAIIAPAPPYALAAPGGFEGLQGLHRQQ